MSTRIPVKIQAQCMQLAKEIDDFSFDCCPENYQATEEERRDNVDDIAYDIAKGNIAYLSDYIQLERKQKEYYHISNIVNRAEKILKLLDAFSK